MKQPFEINKKRIGEVGLTCSLVDGDGAEHHFYHGHEYVDLALPSGTLWASCNVGAEREADCGEYYQYGYGRLKCSETMDFSERNKAIFYSTKDTATEVMGGVWHTPTMEQFTELIKKTNHKLVEKCGIRGLEFCGQNGSKIFLPFASYINVEDGQIVRDAKYEFGYYWSSTCLGDPYTRAMFLGVNTTTTCVYVEGCMRNYGHSIRGVIEREKLIV
jgi:hypothetical protein